MEARLLARVFHRERETGLITENGLVFRAVIHPHALHVRNLCAELEIPEKDREPKNLFRTLTGIIAVNIDAISLNPANLLLDIQ